MQNRSTLVDLLRSLRQIAQTNGDVMLAYLIEMAVVHVLEQESAQPEITDEGFGSGVLR